MYCYFVYGQSVTSEIELPELGQEVEKEPADFDIYIRRARSGDKIPASADFSRTGSFVRPVVRPGPGEIGLLWEERGRALARSGRELIIAADRNCPEAALRLHILGSGLSVLLHQKGIFPIHAGGVAIDGEGVGLMGLWGEGKSTLTAALVELGLPCLTDDLLAIDLRSHEDQPRVLPGIPQIKLWAEAMEGLNLDLKRLHRLIPDVPKYGYRLSPDQMVTAGIPLGAIYVLSTEQSTENAPLIEELGERERFMALLVNWYGSRFGNAFLTPVERIAFMENLTTLVQKIPFYELKRSRSLADLKTVGNALRDHFLKTRPVRIAET